MPTPPPIITAKYQVFCATNPSGRIMQVWAQPPNFFPEVIATDYPDPDTCQTLLVCATDDYATALQSWRANASACRTTCSALGTKCHTLDPQLED